MQEAHTSLFKPIERTKHQGRIIQGPGLNHQTRPDHSNLVTPPFDAGGIELPLSSGSIHPLPRIGGLTEELETIMAIELRSELLEAIKDINQRILNRLRICKGCGSVFLARRNMANLKWCDTCKKRGSR